MTRRQLLALTTVLLLLTGACAGNQLRSEVADRAARTPATTTTETPRGPTSAPATTTTTAPVGEADPPSAASGFPTNWTPKKIDWQPCDTDPRAECGDLVVPLDWAQPDGDQLRLAVGRYRHTGQEQRIGALFMNPGGPGGSGLDFLFGNPFKGAVASKFDLVSWDPRGVGQSAKLDCGSGVTDFLVNDPDPDTAAEQAQIETTASAALADCLTSPGSAKLLGHIGTDDTARDLEALRIALSDKRLNYVGFSYGTYIGERYLALFPTHVRTMVLDGVVDPTAGLAGLLTGQTTAMTSTLDRILASCSKNKRCRVSGDPSALYDRVKARVEIDPLATDDPDHSVGPAEFAVATVAATYDPGSWTDLLTALDDADRADSGQALWDLAQSYYDLADWAAYSAITCLDMPHPNGPADYKTFVDTLRIASPRLGGSIGNEMLPCATWPVPIQDHTGVVTGEGGPDILVIGNTGDAATPYDWAQKVAHMLTKGHLLTYKGEGHTSYGRDQCIDAIVNAYLISLKVPTDGATCSGGAGSSGV